MKKVGIGINGFGRIGRMSLRLMLERKEIHVAGINDLTDSRTLAHLFKYDSVHGVSSREVGHDEKHIIIDGKKIPVTAHKNPADIPWGKMGAEIIVESTGHFLDRSSAEQHLAGGAKKVVLSAPPFDNTIKTFVLGVNDHLLKPEDLIISNASCTTNCAAPMIKVLDEAWGVEDGYITTVHSYTGDQRLHDAPHKDLRRARAAALSIIPTSTGAAKAITKIFPHLEGKLGGCGMRVPVANGSLTDITCILKGTPTVKAINEAFRKAASSGSLKGILQFTEDPIVSVDIVGNPHSCIYDAEFTSVVGKMVKVIGWYDNEAGYSNRLVELLLRLS